MGITVEIAEEIFHDGMSLYRAYMLQKGIDPSGMVHYWSKDDRQKVGRSRVVWHSLFAENDKCNKTCEMTIEVRMCFVFPAREFFDWDEQQKDELLKEWKRRISACWNNKATLVPKDKGECCCEGENSTDCECDKIKISVKPILKVVKRAEKDCNTILVQRGRGRSAAGWWYTQQLSKFTACHEFGHYLGLEDEYPDKRYPDREVFKDRGLMATGSRVHERYFRTQEGYANKKLNECGCRYQVKVSGR